MEQVLRGSRRHNVVIVSAEGRRDESGARGLVSTPRSGRHSRFASRLVFQPTLPCTTCANWPSRGGWPKEDWDDGCSRSRCSSASRRWGSGRRRSSSPTQRSATGSRRSSQSGSNSLLAMVGARGIAPSCLTQARWSGSCVNRARTTGSAPRESRVTNPPHPTRRAEAADPTAAHSSRVHSPPSHWTKPIEVMTGALHDATPRLRP